MKSDSKTFAILAFVWFIFMGVTFVSFGLGALYPPLNRIAQPFVCPNGRLSYSESTSNPMPGTTVTQIGWYCVDSRSGVAASNVDGRIHLWAGVLWGLVSYGVAALLWRGYKKGIVWVQKLVHAMGIAAIGLIILISLLPVFGLFYHLLAPGTDAARNAPDTAFDQLTSQTKSDFSSTSKPLEDWNGIPIMEQALAGAETSQDAYSYKVAQTSSAIEAYYTAKLDARGWTLERKRWQGMKFLKDKSVLLVTFAPAAHMHEWVVTLTIWR